jgi:hypothetical protein
MNSRSFVLSALIAGAVMGVLANLPVLNLINCILCFWIWVGGILGVFLYRQFQHGESSLTPGQGAGLGALAGVIGVFVGVLVYLATAFVSMPIFAALARSLQVGDLPFQQGGAGALLSSAAFFMVVDLIAYPLFGAISGFIGASLMKKEPQAAPPPPPPPPPAGSTAGPA